jgi:hypothetical protein
VFGWVLGLVLFGCLLLGFSQAKPGLRTGLGQAEATKERICDPGLFSFQNDKSSRHIAYIGTCMKY